MATIYPGCATIMTNAGTFPLDSVRDMVLSFYLQATVGSWRDVAQGALDERGQVWYPPKIDGLSIAEGYQRVRGMLVDPDYDLYVTALATSCGKSELRLSQYNDSGIFEYDRTFAGPWLKQGLTLVRPAKVAGGTYLGLQLGARHRREGRKQGQAIGVYMSCLLFHVKHTIDKGA